MHEWVQIIPPSIPPPIHTYDPEAPPTGPTVACQADCSYNK